MNLLAFLMSFIFFLFYLAVVIFMVIANWKFLVKAGQPGWACLIPIYNIIVLIQVAQKPVWWFLLLFVPILNIIIMIIVFNEISKAFGKGTGFTVGLIFLSIVFIPILAFGDAKYWEGAAPVEAPPVQQEPAV